MKIAKDHEFQHVTFVLIKTVRFFNCSG